VTEKEIIKGCLLKDSYCQNLLFKQYGGGLMTICLRYSGNRADAEDLLQESFIRIFSSIQQYKFEGSFEGWIRKITVNICLKALSKKRIQFANPSLHEQKFASVEPLAVSNLTEDELIKMISCLPDGYRTVFNLYVMEEYSHDEIAGMLHIEPATSRSQLLKARRLLQKQILSNQTIKICNDR
jgi:RNA polymerase sigma factor (sigma-70 family)